MRLRPVLVLISVVALIPAFAFAYDGKFQGKPKPVRQLETRQNPASPIDAGELGKTLRRRVSSFYAAISEDAALVARFCRDDAWRDQRERWDAERLRREFMGAAIIGARLPSVLNIVHQPRDGRISGESITLVRAARLGGLISWFSHDVHWIVPRDEAMQFEAWQCIGHGAVEVDSPTHSAAPDLHELMQLIHRYRRAPAWARNFRELLQEIWQARRGAAE